MSDRRWLVKRRDSDSVIYRGSLSEAQLRARELNVDYQTDNYYVEELDPLLWGKGFYTDPKAIKAMAEQIKERKRRNPLEGWNPEP